MPDAKNCGFLRVALATALAVVLGNGPVLSQSPLPGGWEQAIAEINEKSVTATISFLASDELAGRGTPSDGYQVASAYIAARLRGAGLQGGMPDGSFYQVHKLQTVRTPQDGIVFFDLNGGPSEPLGLLAAGNERLEFSGEIPLIDLQSELEGVPWAGPVMAREVPTDAAPQRAVSQLARQVTIARSAGATALVLYVNESSPLVTALKQNRGRARPDLARDRFGIPVLLVQGEPPVNMTARLVLPGKIVEEATVRNVIGVLPGSDPELSREAVIFSAHLDHLGENPNESSDWIYNGADDNASGSTAVATLADAFAALTDRPARTLIFICFWGEESGLLGSRQYVNEPTWPLENIVANINIEMIGRPEAGAREKIWVTGWSASDLGPLMRQAAEPHGFEIFEHPSYSARLYRASDNWPFAQRGVVAHSFSAGSLHSDYHQPSDEWEKLDLPHMTRVIQALFWASLPLAKGEVTPRKTP